MAAKTKPAPEPMTFAEIANKRLRERIMQYRDLVQRHANGGQLDVEQMEAAADLMEQIGLPQYTFERDADAMRRYTLVQAKVQAAVDAAPEHKSRATELAEKIEATRKQLAVMQEEHRLAVAKGNKSGAYTHTLNQLQSEHPTVLADIDTAVRLRAEELDRRKRGTLEVAGT